jgi:DNA replication and repair protein RecF
LAAIRQIRVSGLRNLQDLALTGFAGINILAGPNASGKTSFLEAINLAGLGRSFRSARLKPLISNDKADCVVFVELESSTAKTIGIKRSRTGRGQLRINQEPVNTLALLAEALPLQVINADSFQLIDGGPKARRQFMDWGVFHVEPEFLDCWRRTQRALKQRNSELRHAKITGAKTGVWDQAFIEDAARVDAMRTAYMAAIKPLFFKALQALTELPGLTLDYHRGWPADTGLAAALQDSRQRDRERGFTTVGPHRANIDIRLGELPAAEVLSRGQQKLVAAALRLSQGQYLKQQGGRDCVYLLDDLPAELDPAHRQALCRLLEELGSQVFITCVDAGDMEGLWADRRSVKMFHVEHGEIRPETASGGGV